MSLRRRLVQPFLGRRALQPFFERLHRLALAGMNVGGGDDPRDSGEAAVIRLLPQGATVFDVGANVGRYSSLVLQIVAGAKLYAFEPHPISIAAYRQRIGDAAHLYECGLGELDGHAEFFDSNVDHALASTTLREFPGLSWQSTGEIQIRSLDNVCAEEGIERIDLLKIDVEGGELGVLRGARRMLQEGRVDRVQFEFGGCAIDSRIYLRDLVHELPGYQLYRVVRDGLTPVVYDEKWEIFTTTNFLAVKA